jgi:hypothetical protein
MSVWNFFFFFFTSKHPIELDQYFRRFAFWLITSWTRECIDAFCHKWLLISVLATNSPNAGPGNFTNSGNLTNWHTLYMSQMKYAGTSFVVYNRSINHFDTQGHCNCELLQSSVISECIEIFQFLKEICSGPEQCCLNRKCAEDTPEPINMLAWPRPVLTQSSFHTTELGADVISLIGCH